MAKTSLMSCSLAPGTQVSSSANLCNQVEALEGQRAAEAQKRSRYIYVPTRLLNEESSAYHGYHKVTKKENVEEGSQEPLGTQNETWPMLVPSSEKGT